jgi:hypothetical protein
MKKSAKKLQLNRETLRLLRLPESVVGASNDTVCTIGPICNPNTVIETICGCVHSRLC